VNLCNSGILPLRCGCRGLRQRAANPGAPPKAPAPTTTVTPDLAVSRRAMWYQEWSAHEGILDNARLVIVLSAQGPRLATTEANSERCHRGSSQRWQIRPPQCHDRRQGTIHSLHLVKDCCSVPLPPPSPRCQVSAVSRKRHTTRTSILGVLTVGPTQLIFTDTPGFVERRSVRASLRRALGSC
jgi:hypothetical protein